MAENRHEKSPEEMSGQASQNKWEHISEDPREGGVILGNSWQPLAEIARHEEDLVSIFQDDFDSVEKAASSRELEPATPAQTVQSAFQSQVDTQPVQLNAGLENWAVGPEIPVATTVTFYLAPRQTKHFLIGGLSRELREWMPEICKTYGWELDLLSVRPDYLKWTLRDFPESLTRDMLLTVREKTSQRIFRIFPNLKEGAASPDFWAPGYLVDNQNRDFSTQALMAHVAQNRLGG